MVQTRVWIDVGGDWDCGGGIKANHNEKEKVRYNRWELRFNR